MRTLLPLSIAAYVAVLPLFAPQGSLSADARVGVVSDRQGSAHVRPATHERWTPLAPKSLLMPGDVVRTPARGANALEVRLQGGGGFVLGPGGLVELDKKASLHVLRGEIEVTPPETGGLAVRGPGSFAQRIEETTVLRASRDKTAVLATAPRWLTGYRASTTDEWMGSLIANVDGRDTPLEIGYHKVGVDIRDQIARTTVEQSFKNTTKTTLEGVFYFPLPADASISGFGMWIGSELVEADIVEKQRARRIYEDILRRKKDPGLLEWSGGNLFKARVFPILPHSEKRIRIRYTQAIPLEGSKLRYRYALRSELLRRHPLRKLELDVTVSSQVPIASISSPTHEVITRVTEHAGSARFSGEDYTPRRDFEVAIELSKRDALTAVPHRRGDDGYFMLMLAPPESGGAGAWQRTLLPERGALELLLIADTSGSMHEAARESQARFIQSLLGLCGKNDRFRLMTCDIDAQWYRDDAVAVDDATVSGALDFLAQRESLGWTDLDGAFRAALQYAGKDTVVVYVGDGIGTTGNADPGELAARLASALGGGRGVFHAVFTSSTYERGVLDAIAYAGGGSVRGVGDDPDGAAFDLLREAAQPSIKDLRVRFEGIRTARVYPQDLPNLALGTQQVVLGRFLPTGQDQHGKVVVTGTLGGKPVSYETELVVSAGNRGNSFLPRLWARRHLDALLAEGKSKSVRDEIIGFSEEFGIMTPYTSFLVLESDADREKYGVARRVKMRDGEQFFAAGHDQAKTALLREQMKVAKSWRVGLRRRMLRELARLGKDLHVAVGQISTRTAEAKRAANVPISGGRRRGGLAKSKTGNVWGGPASPGPVETMNLGLDAGRRRDMDLEAVSGGKKLKKHFEEAFDEEEEAELPDESNADLRRVAKSPAARPARKRRARGFADGYFEPETSYDRKSIGIGGGSGGKPGRAIATLATLGFPGLAAAPMAPEPYATPKWPARALELLRSLDRRASLQAMRRGIDVRTLIEGIHALNGMRTSFASSHGLYGPAGFFTRHDGRRQQPIDQWLTAKERGALASGLRLGRSRKAAANDRKYWPFALYDFSQQDLVRTYQKWGARVADADGDRVLVVLTAPAPAKREVTLTIDAAKHVVVAVEEKTNGKTTSRTLLSDFVEAGGMSWATKIERFDDKNRLVQRVQSIVAEVEDDAAALAAAIGDHGDVIFAGVRDPRIGDAKQRAFEAKASVIDQLMLAAYWMRSQQWKRVFAAFQKAEGMAAGKAAMPWVRADLERRGRRGTEFKTGVAALAASVATSKGPLASWRAQRVASLAQTVYDANERLALHVALEKAWVRPGPDAAWSRVYWRRERASRLAAAGQREAAWDIYAALATERPWDIEAVMQHVSALATAQRIPDAIAAAKTATETGKWLQNEAYRLFERWTSLLYGQRDLNELLRTLETWTARNPENEQPYVRRVSTLLFLNREGEADAWVTARLSEESTKLENAARAKLGAAITLALGNGWNFFGNRIETQWVEPLGKLARRLLRSEDTQTRSLASRITGNWRFRRTDSYAKLRKGLLDDMTRIGGIESMSVARISSYLSLVPLGRGQVDAKIWRNLVDRLRTRWEKTATTDSTSRYTRSQLGAYVLRLLDGWQEKKEALGIARSRLAAATPDERPARANDLMTRLFQLDWTRELQAEIIATIPAFQPKTVAPARFADDIRSRIAASAVRRVTDNLERMRRAAFLGKPKDTEKLPRTELRLRKREARAKTLRALIEDLRTAKASKRARRWFDIERVGLAVRLGQKLGDATADARELLESTPADRRQASDQIMRERCYIAIAYAATRRRATPAQVEAAVDLHEKLARATPVELDDDDPELAPRIDGRYHLFRLLIALDEGDAARTALRAWIVPAKVESKWRVALAYLEAERGKLEPAIEQLGAVAKRDELAPRDWATLAAWQLVVGDAKAREASLIGQYRATPEYELSNRVWAERQRVSRRTNGVPADLNPEIMIVMRALLAKASHPSNYVWRVRSLYDQVKDHRVLDCLPYGVIGHTPQGIYPFLQRIAGTMRNVHEEATCDALAANTRKLSAGAKREPDRRGLLYLTALIERRAAEVINQPGPHADKGLEAMRSAFPGEFLNGERRQVAAFLAGLGKLPQRRFADEQVRQLGALLDQTAKGTADRLQIAQSYYKTMWLYGERQAAIDGLLAAIDEVRSAKTSVTARAGSQLQQVVNWMLELHHHAKAEDLLNQELASEKSIVNRLWLEQRLFSVWVHALKHHGATRSGRGESLYRLARAKMEESMWKHGKSRLSNTLSTYCSLHVAASSDVRTAGSDLLAFARKRLPELLTYSPTNANYLVGTVAGSIKKLLGARAGLAYLVERLETEPRWWSRIGQDGWRRHSWVIAQWRAKTRTLGDLGNRLLAIVLTEIERDLTSLESRNRTIYTIGSRYFWRSKRSDFGRVAEKVIELHPDSPARQLYAARYLWTGLRYKHRAADTLVKADKRGKLTDGGRWQLVRWQHDLRDFAASLPHLDRLLEKNPRQLSYRLAKVRALHETDNDKAARALVAATETLWKTKKWWNESAIAQLARVCRSARLLDQAVPYYEELIPLHQRTHANRGIGRGTLSAYYSELSDCYAKAGNYDKAIDAASSAVVSWGPTHRNRANAIKALYSVLRRVPDLDGFIAKRDAAVKKTGLDAPLIRKLTGKLYLSRRMAKKAIPQLLAARDLQPNDDETHAALRRAYDALDMGAAALRSLVAQIRISPRKLDLYTELARRFTKLGEPAGAERAWTSCVEALPNEAASHRLLAEHRTSQARHAAAVVQWRQVVRIRSDEPDGWLALASAQIAAREKDGARKTLEHVIGGTWDKRFGDVKSKAARILARL